MIKRIVECFVIGCLLLGAIEAIASEHPVTVVASSSEKKEKPKAEGSRKKSEGTTEAKPSTKPQPNQECPICRWFELQQATISTRYRSIESSASVLTNNQVQSNQAFKARFKFDREGKYSFNFGLFSGNNFTGSWNNTGIGTGTRFTNMYVKQAFVAAKPIKGVEVQFGGLYVERGENTEITSYDNDAYIMGERVVVKRPRTFFFDQVTLTYAHLGDLTKPNVLDRLHRLDQSNYHQLMVSKVIGKRASVTADYTFQSGVETMREAAKIITKELRVVDSIRFETYQRMDVNRDGGFAMQAEKAWFRKRLTVSGGYAQIDKSYGGLNGDRYNKGKRLFVNGSFTITPEFSVSTFATRAIDNPYAVANHTRFDLIFSYNLLKTFQRKGYFK
jgi:hypothetical protein